MEESDFSEGNEEGDEGDEEILDPNNPEHELPLLERDFNKVVSEIEANPEAAPYAEEYTKLYDNLIKYYERQKTLQDSTVQLKDQIDTNTNKLEAALKLSEIDQKTISTLKQEIEKAWHLADSAHSREQQAQEVIDNLRKQVETLNEEIAIKSKFQESEEAVDTTAAKKDDLEKETEKLHLEITQLQTKLSNALRYQDELERKNSEANLKINEINGQLEDQINDWQQQKNNLDKVEQDAATLRVKLEDRDAIINSLNRTSTEHQKEITKLENNVKDQKTTIERLNRESEIAELKRLKLVDEQKNTNDELEVTKNTLTKKIGELKTSEKDANHYKADLLKVSKMKDALDKKIQKSFTERDEIAEDRNKLRARIGMLEKEIEDYKKYADLDKRTLDSANKERDILSKAVVKHQNDIKEQEKLIKIQEFSKHKLEVELDNFFNEINRHKKTIAGLEHEKKRLDDEVLVLKKAIEDNEDEIKQKKTHLIELNRLIEEQEGKFRLQQNLFESVRADRNAMQKSLQEATAETDELKDKLKIVFHQTEQLKEDIAMKEKLFVKEENIMRKVVKENENLKLEIDAELNKVKTLKNDIKEMKEEEKRLHKALAENEREIKEQSKKIEHLMNERDILGSQLVRRNDEIALMNEKIKILQITLTRGETQYDQRLEDIRLLKIEIKRLRQEKNVWTKSMNGIFDYRQEIFRLERDLTKCRLKCRALEEEVQNPLNLHRWRKLEGSDPDVLQLIQKVNLLQKRLLKQTSESIERERQLKEAEKLYLNLRQVLSTQPSPEVRKNLLKTQRALKARTGKLKALVAELNMSHLKVSEYKSDFERVNDELQIMKKKFLDERRQSRAQSLAISSSREIHQQHKKRESASEVKFTGGGFRMSVQQISTK